jgi:hypothetical protein
VAAGAGHIKVVSNPLHIEAFACWKALLFAADHGMMSLEVETVCVLLQQALSSREWDAAPEGILFKELQFLLLTSFNHVKVKSVSRVCNRVAHRLASEGAGLGGGDHVWPDGYPDFVSNLLANDLLLLVECFVHCCGFFRESSKINIIKITHKIKENN